MVEKNGIKQTRSCSYFKNDQAYVELSEKEAIDDITLSADDLAEWLIPPPSLRNANYLF